MSIQHLKKNTVYDKNRKKIMGSTKCFSSNRESNLLTEQRRLREISI